MDTQEKILDHIKHLQAVKDGKLELKLVPVLLDEVFEEVLNSQDQRLKNKGITLELSSCRPELSVWAEKPLSP